MLDTPAPPSGPGEEPARPLPPRSWRDRVEGIADATGTTPLRLAVGTVLAAVAVLVALWVARPAPAPPEVALPFASTSAGVASTTTSTTIPVEVVVHVAGAVARPGVHRLPAGARVVDGIDAAGGLTADADGARVNLAALVGDGERIYVPRVGEDPPAVVGPGPGVAGAEGADPGPVDLNTADAAALDALPGVGPTTAAAIIEHRERIGGFTSVDELLDVRGIGEAKLEQLRPLVTV